MAAWAGTTTEMHPHQAAANGCILVSTNMAGSTLGHDLIAFPGSTVSLSTASDFVRVGLHKPDGKLMVYAEILPLTADAFYPAMVIKYPPAYSTESPSGTYSQLGGAWGCQRGPNGFSGLASSTIITRDLSGYKIIGSSTSVTTASTESMFGALWGPLDTGKFAFNMGSASTTLIDKYQSYVEFAIMCCTHDPRAVGTTSFVELATNANSTQINIMAIEVG